jgi:hypothetical protein
MKTKFCRKCGSFKSLFEFHKNSCRKDGLADWCKDCMLNHKKSWYLKNKNNILARQSDYSKEHHKINKDKKKIWDRTYLIKHREQINLKQVLKRKHNKNLRILHNLRGRVLSALHGKTKSKRTLELLGCTIDFLKQHLESQFKPGMSWNNYGTGYNGMGMKEWHIDHINPCAKFDLRNPEEQKLCFHWSNLQPLWAKENWNKNRF